MVAAPIAITGAVVVPGVPVVLFPTRIVGGGVDADGRFLINTVVESGAAPITIVQHWNPTANP